MQIRRWLLTSMLFCTGWANAQDSVSDHLSDSLPTEWTHGLSIHGNLDFYYKNVFHGLKEGTTSFTSANQRFELGMASLQLGYQAKNMGVVLDLGFGPRAREFAYTDEGAMAAIKQAYIYYEPVHGLRLSAGTWATHIGYEVLDPALNANYSMSYLFSTGPFSNTGLKAEYTFGKHQVMVGVSNPTDYRQVPQGLLNRKTLIARYSYTNGNGLALALNYSGGKQVDTANLQQLDVVATVPVNDIFSLGWNGSIVFRKKQTAISSNAVDQQSQHWWGQAVYLKAKLTSKLQLALREEYFDDQNGISVIPLLGHVWSSTATLRFEQGHFAVLPEIRWDRFSTPYATGSSNANHGQLYGVMAVTFQF